MTVRGYQVFGMLAVVALLGCSTHKPPAGVGGGGLPSNPTPFLMAPASPEMNRQAPTIYKARLETTKGPIILEIHRDWSPHGADRFYNLARMGYYDNTRVFRIRAGNWAQFGINGDPRISKLWRTQTIPDDPRTQSNTRGTIAYAFAVPNGRTTQMFINLKDNAATHDAPADGVPFVPFGKVIEGMEVADALYADYAENAGGGIRGGKQDPLFNEGNAYLDREFPKLDHILKITIVES